MYLFVIRMVIVCQMEGAPSKFLLIVSNLNTKTTNALKFDVLILGELDAFGSGRIIILAQRSYSHSVPNRVTRWYR